MRDSQRRFIFDQGFCVNASNDLYDALRLQPKIVGGVVDRKRVDTFQRASARASGINFQACSLNDSRVAAGTSIHRDVA
jgi:hypothetical protein